MQPSAEKKGKTKEDLSESKRTELDDQKTLYSLKHIDRQSVLDFFKTYGLAATVPFGSLILTILLDSASGTSTSFLLFFAAVTISAWYGGLKPGLLTTLVSALVVSYFFLPYKDAATTTLLQASIFFLEGFLVSFVIDKCRRTNLIQEYKKREKEQTRLLMRLLEENAKAREEFKARDEFLSIASHELKTPLTSMLLKLQTVLHNVRNVSLANFSVENLLKMLESAEQQSTRLSRMINDLLNVSLITSGKLDLELEEVNLTKVVNDVLDRFSEKIERDGSKVASQMHEDVIGEWDKLRIEQVVTNLISNALKYGNGKPIEIRLSKQAKKAILTILDHGVGIHAKDHKRIFGRFERGASSQTYKGLGVGLYITREIVRAHRGTIAVKSTLESGSKFTVELPLRN